MLGMSGRDCRLRRRIELTLASTRSKATASFGAPLSWSPDTKAALPEGHDMSFVEAITGVSENMFLTIALPDVLLFNLPMKK